MPGASFARPGTRFLKATRVPSGERDGHSTFVCSVVTVRVFRSPLIRYVLPLVASVA